MKTKLSTQLNAVVWIVAGILTLQPLFSGLPVENFVTTIVATLFWMAVYYLFNTYIASEFLLKKKLPVFFGISVVITLILPFIGYLLLFLVKSLFGESLSDLFNLYSISMHLSGFKALALAGVYGSFFRLICEYFKES